jgi:hypothetical protein
MDHFDVHRVLAYFVHIVARICWRIDLISEKGRVIFPLVFFWPFLENKQTWAEYYRYDLAV